MPTTFRLPMTCFVRVCPSFAALCGRLFSSRIFPSTYLCVVTSQGLGTTLRLRHEHFFINQNLFLLWLKLQALSISVAKSETSSSSSVVAKSSPARRRAATSTPSALPPTSSACVKTPPSSPPSRDSPPPCAR